MRFCDSRDGVFYKTKIKKLIQYLKNLRNPQINEILDKKYNIKVALSEESISCLTEEWFYYKCDIHANSTIDMLLASYEERSPIYYLMMDIGDIVLDDDKISNKQFISYLYKNEIALLMGCLLFKFHDYCYEKAIKNKSVKDLIQIYNFRYITHAYKRKVAVSIVELLRKSKHANNDMLQEWSFNTLAHKMAHLKSLEQDLNVSHDEYMKLLSIYAKLEANRQVKSYIYNCLYEKGVLQTKLELQKQAFKDNLQNSHEKKYFNLLFETAKRNNDIDTINWIQSLYIVKPHRFKTLKFFVGKKEVDDFLNLYGQNKKVA